MPETTTSTSTAKPKVSATKTAELSAAIRDEIIASVKQAQQLTLDAITTWVDVASKIAPVPPPFVPARTDVLEGVGNYFGLAEELLASQHKFAVDLVSVLVPAS